MNLFHTHFFQESTTDLETLYCRCGKIKDIHRHSWVETAEVKFSFIGKGLLMKCTKCGEVKILDGKELLKNSDSY